MGFWGIEVKPGKPLRYRFDNAQGKVHVTQATLGSGSSTERSALQCSLDDKKPIFLCSLLPDKVECCPLNLEFEDDDVVSFSVIGPRSIHLSGILLDDAGDHVEDYYDSDSFGEDIAQSDSEESTDYESDDDYDDGFINDGDLDMLPSSPAPDSGVVIEEIQDDDKPTDGQTQHQQPKANQSSGASDSKTSGQQIVTRNVTEVLVLASEDEDGFPISASRKSKHSNQKPGSDAGDAGKTEESNGKKKKKGKDNADDGTGSKRKNESTEVDGQSERQQQKKKKKHKKTELNEEEKTSDKNANQLDVKDPEISNALSSKSECDQKQGNEKRLDTDMHISPAENGSEKKKKKKKKNKNGEKSAEATNADKEGAVTALGDQNKSSLQLGEKQTGGKSSQVRTFPNGLIIEELAMGKPDGKRASPGKKVSVHYIGKLKNNGKIFDSNVGRAPFKFRLGVGQVIKGWDVGVNGMRIGDKRRLVIPPSMGYGAKGAGGKIPPNAWLLFDVELVDVS